MSLAKRAAAGADGKNIRLTAREKRVIELVVAGYANKDIAQAFAASQPTIDHLVASISAKLGVANRLELLLVALDQRLIGYAEIASPRQEEFLRSAEKGVRPRQEAGRR